MPKVKNVNADLELFAVVCTDLHFVVGPFPPDVAYKMAKKMNAEGKGCTYLPIPMEFTGEMLMIDESAERDEDRGYL